MYQQQFAQNQPAGLPYRTDVMEQQPLNVSGNNPPYLPQIQNLDPQLGQYLGFITGCLALEITNNANTNSLRRFMFNQCAVNQFQNSDFDQLVRATLDYISLLFYQQRVPTIDQAVASAVPEMAALMCAVNTRAYPALGNVVPREIVNEIHNDIHKFDTILMQIQNPNVQIQPQMQQQQFHQPRQGFQQGGFQQQQVPRGAVDPRFNRPVQQQQSTMPGRATNSSVFSTGGGKSAFSPSSGDGNSKFSKTGFVPTGLTPRQEAPVNTQQQQPQQQNDAPPTFQPAEPIMTAYENSMWKPTSKFPYYPVHDPAMMELMLVTQPNGTTEPTLRKRNIDMMDYDKHAIPTAFGKPPAVLDLSQSARTLSRIQYGVDEINKTSDGPAPADEGEEVIPVKPYINPSVLIDTSLHSAWLNSSLERLQLIDRPEVYRSYATILEPILTDVDESEAVRALSSCATYIMAREYIESSHEVLSAELATAFDLRMTNEVNRSIKQELGLPKLRIDSFREDLVGLLEHLETVEGPDIKAAFLSRQRAHIMAASRPVNEETVKMMTESFLEGREFPENALPSITYLSTSYSLTYLNLRSFELDAELSADGLGSAVTETLAPMLYSLVTGIFSDAEKHQPIDRFLIRTLDGRILEATKGAIGKNMSLISLIK